MTKQHGEEHGKNDGAHSSGRSLEYKVGAFDYLAGVVVATAGGIGGCAIYDALGLAALTAGTALSGGVGALLFAGASAIGLGYLGLKAGEYVHSATAKKPKKEDHKEEHGEADNAQQQALMQQIAAAQGKH